MQSIASLMSLDKHHDIASSEDFDDDESTHNTSDDMTWSSKINQMTADFQSFTSQDDIKRKQQRPHSGELKNAFEDFQHEEEDLG